MIHTYNPNTTAADRVFYCQKILIKFKIMRASSVEEKQMAGKH